MNVSVEKTKPIWFKPQWKMYSPKVRMGITEVKFEKSIKYLGVHLDEQLDFGKHITELIMDLEKRLNILRMFAGNRWGGHPETLLTILRSVVRGKNDYGCIVCANAKQKWLNKINIVYNKSLRICSRALMTTTIEALHVETGFIPLGLRRRFLGEMEVMKTYERKLPLATRFLAERNKFDDHGMTYLEKCNSNGAEVQKI